jgi:hypothetical protein
MSPNLITTLSILASALIVAGLANWQLRRPVTDRFLPILPWLGIQFVAALIAIVMLGHLVTLLTGQEFKSRFGY